MLKLRHFAYRYWCIWAILTVIGCFFLVLCGVDYIFEQRAYRRWERYSYENLNRNLEEGQKVDEKTEMLRKLQEELANQPKCNCNIAGQASEAIPEPERLVSSRGLSVAGNSTFDCDDFNNFDSVLILTPARRMGTVVKRYFRNLVSLSYPHCRIRISIGLNQDDDETFKDIQAWVSTLKHNFSSIDVYRLSTRSSDFVNEGIDRHQRDIQLSRRSHLAQVRNQLLFRALSDEKWVMWLDSDVRELPQDLLNKLIAAQKHIVVPSCMYRVSAQKLAVYDKNSWRETKASHDAFRDVDDKFLMVEGYNQSKRLYLDEIQSEGSTVELDGVGGCCLLVYADVHRKGLVFPPFLFKNHVETEGFAQIAKAMGYKLYGMPFVQVIH